MKKKWFSLFLEITVSQPQVLYMNAREKSKKQDIHFTLSIYSIYLLALKKYSRSIQISYTTLLCTLPAIQTVFTFEYLLNPWQIPLCIFLSCCVTLFFYLKMCIIEKKNKIYTPLLSIYMHIREKDIVSCNNNVHIKQVYIPRLYSMLYGLCQRSF